MTAAPPPADESLRPALDALALVDPDIARAYALLGLPAARPREPGYGGLLRIIVGQQVSALAARAIVARLEAAAGGPPTPESFLALGDDALRAIGLSRQKIRYGRALAEDVLAGRIDLDAVAATADDEAAIAHLTRARGIGRWTAEIYLLFALRRPDVWPIDDLAVRHAAARLKRWPGPPTKALMQALGEAYRPHRSAAARFLWHFYRHPGVALGGDDAPAAATGG